MPVERYIISEASKAVQVEPHVLRYWEEELMINIPRNEMGHRYYREEDIKLLNSVKKLKTIGFRLKAIKLLLPDITKVEALDNEQLLNFRDKLEEAIYLTEEAENLKSRENCNSVKGIRENDERLFKFRTIMTDIVGEALVVNNEIMARKVSASVKESVIKEMNFLFRANEECEEERFRKLDRTIREFQMGRQQAAASSEKRKRKFFK